MLFLISYNAQELEGEKTSSAGTALDSANLQADIRSWSIGHLNNSGSKLF